MGYPPPFSSNVVEVQDGHASPHTSLMSDLALNPTGKRMATCGTDRSISIWNLEPAGGSQRFVLSGSITEAHSAPVMKLSWACTTYGQILVSCGLDNGLKIWQEVTSVDQVRGADSGKPNKDEKVWRMLWGTVILGGLTDVKFAPRQFGLKISASSSDGEVQTLVASGMKFEEWEQTRKFEPTKKLATGSHRVGVTSMSWNPSTLEETELLVMGTDSGAVIIWACEAQNVRDKWFPIPITASASPDIAAAGAPSAAATTSSASASTSVLEHSSAVTDVAWAPSIGRRFHLIASCSKDGNLLITKLYPVDPASKTPTGYRAVPVFAGQQVHGANTIWRVSWNLTGTTLASSGDDGRVMLWRQSLMDVDAATGEPTWKRVHTLQPKAASDFVA